MKPNLYIGTAAWTIPKEHRAEFPLIGTEPQSTQLQNYAARLQGVEINTSFYRDHKPETYLRWAQTTPPHFRFSVKLSKVFTHEQKLTLQPLEENAGAPLKSKKKTSMSAKLEKKSNATQDLGQHLAVVKSLGEKLGAILIQLPPKLQYESATALRFFTELRVHYKGPVAFEPRHLSWDSNEARELLKATQISRVIADPQPYFTRELTLADFAQNMVYFRLHGSPDIYKSDYDLARLEAYARQIESFAEAGLITWCIFDNTTFGHATGDALELEELLTHRNTAAAVRFGPSHAPGQRENPSH